MSDRVGFWADMKNPYITYKDDYIESEWWSLKEIWKKGLLYKGFKVVPYCPRCGTALSSHEVAQGYKEVSDVSATVRFKVVGREDTYILAWTTTPWTLPSNVALCVNAHEDYCEFQLDGQTYILAQALLHAVFGEKAHEGQVLKTMKGAELLRHGLRAALPLRGRHLSPRKGLVRGQRRLRHADRRHRHRAHRPGVRRGRRARGPRQPAALCAAGGHAGQVRGGHALGGRRSSSRSTKR